MADADPSIRGGRAGHSSEHSKLPGLSVAQLLDTLKSM